MNGRSIRNSHYGTLREEFLKTEFPMQYQILLMTGGLSAHLKKTEKAAQALKRRLTAGVHFERCTPAFFCLIGKSGRIFHIFVV